MSFATTILANEAEPEKGTPGSSSTPARAGGPEQPGQSPKQSPFSGAGAAYIMVAAALLGVGIGYAIDGAAGTRPLWTLVCFFLFMAAGTYHMIKEGRK